MEFRKLFSVIQHQPLRQQKPVSIKLGLVRTTIYGIEVKTRFQCSAES